MARKRREEKRASCLRRGERTLTRPPWPRTPGHRLPGLPAPRWSRGGTMSSPDPARRPAPPPHTARTDPSIVPRQAQLQKPRGPSVEGRGCQAGQHSAPTEGSDPGHRTALAAKVLEARIAAAAQAPPPAGQPARPRPLMANRQAPPPARQPARTHPPTYRPPKLSLDQLASLRSECPVVKLRPWVANLSAHPGGQGPLQTP